jgi:hypothetical protein
LRPQGWNAGLRCYARSQRGGRSREGEGRPPSVTLQTTASTRRVGTCVVACAYICIHRRREKMCTWVSSSRQAFCACAGSRACGARAWRACPPATFRACVCITAGPSTKLFACSHHPKEEPSHAFSIFKLPSCVFITAGPSTKLFTCSGIGLFYADSGFFDGNILFFFTHTFLSDRLVVSHVLP